MSIGSLSGAMVVPDTPPPGEGPRAGRPCGRPTASRVLVHRPIGTAVCYAPKRFHGSRSLSASSEKGDQFRQLTKTKAVENWQRADTQRSHGRRIGPVGPFPRHGKRAVGSSLEDQRFNAPDSPELKDRELLPLERVERMGDLRRSRKGAGVRCSYRRPCHPFGIELSKKDCG